MQVFFQGLSTVASLTVVQGRLHYNIASIYVYICTAFRAKPNISFFSGSSEPIHDHAQLLRLSLILDHVTALRAMLQLLWIKREAVEGFTLQPLVFMGT